MALSLWRLLYWLGWEYFTTFVWVGRVGSERRIWLECILMLVWVWYLFLFVFDFVYCRHDYDKLLIIFKLSKTQPLFNFFFKFFFCASFVFQYFPLIKKNAPIVFSLWSLCYILEQTKKYYLWIVMTFDWSDSENEEFL